MKRISTLIAAGALLSAQAAQAQEACIEPADLDDAVRYSMPLLFDATMDSCADQYASDGFMMTEGAQFADGFRALQSDAWPGTLRLLEVFAAGDDGDEMMGAMLASMPEETLRPFVDTLVLQLVGEEIKPESCGKIESAVELLAPLPPENVSGLVVFIAEQVRPDKPAICGIEPKASDK